MPIERTCETFISLSLSLSISLALFFSLRREIQPDTRNTEDINSARGKTRAGVHSAIADEELCARRRRLSGTLNRVSRRNFGNVLRIQRVEFISRVRRRHAICMRNYTLPAQPAASNITRVYTHTG